MSGTDLFPGFDRVRIDTGSASINLRCGGDGYPLLLLHGYPQTHVCWHRIAGPLAQRFRVVAPDLRGYGDSDGPVPGPSGEGYGFSDMAQDQLAVMSQLGHEEFLVVGHDRGARVAHRLALDHPDRVKRVVLIDIVPTFHLWSAPTREWAIGSWHWPFMAQRAGLAERMIAAVPAAEFLPAIMSRPDAGLSIFADEAYAEYVRCFNPKMIRASCADYRACAAVEFAKDKMDRSRRVECPTLVLWGSDSHTASATPGVLEIWRDYCRNVEGVPIPGGHFLPEQAPEAVLQRLQSFL